MEQLIGLVCQVDIVVVWCFDELIGNLPQVQVYLFVAPFCWDYRILADERNYISYDSLFLIFILQVVARVIQDKVRNKPCCFSHACVLAHLALNNFHVLLDVRNNDSAIVHIANWSFLLVSKHYSNVIESVFRTH